jgi:hypothetical protein
MFLLQLDLSLCIFKPRTVQKVENTMNRRARLQVSEMREFASFTDAEQRFIKQSLHVSKNETAQLERMERTTDERYLILAQSELYAVLPTIRDAVPENFCFDGIQTFMARTTVLAAFDLHRSKIRSFSAFRFLYERLLGARARPWLPAIFLSAAALPHIKPDKRKILLQSISEQAVTAPGWSRQEPTFFPEWIDD